MAKDLSLVDGAEAAECGFCVVAGVIVPDVLVEGGDRAHLLLAQLEIEQRDVLDHALQLAGFGNRNGASLHCPTQQHLGRRLTVPSRDRLDAVQVAGAVVCIGHLELDVGRPRQVAVRHDLKTRLSRHPQQLGLREVGVHLHLERSRLDRGVIQHLADGRRPDVAEPDIAAQTLPHKCLHRLPSLLVSDACVKYHAAIRRITVDARVEVFPLRWVSLLMGHICQRNGEVNQVQINIVKAKVRQRPLTSRFDMLWPMERVPQLANHK